MDPNIGYIAAFAGGIVSFLSPCVLPIVPAYLSVIGGVSIGDLSEGSIKVRTRIVRHTLLFIAGFSTVFVMLGLSLTALRGTFINNAPMMAAISGALLIGMAVFLLLSQVIDSPRLAGEYRFHPSLNRFGAWAAPVAGAAFAFGWTPCIGPVLTSVLAIATTQTETVRGGFLLAAYSLGLGLPFLITGIAFGRLTGTFTWLKRHSRQINVGAAIVLGAFGLLLLLNRFTFVTTELQEFLRAIGLERLITLG